MNSYCPKCGEPYGKTLFEYRGSEVWYKCGCGKLGDKDKIMFLNLDNLEYEPGEWAEELLSQEEIQICNKWEEK